MIANAMKVKNSPIDTNIWWKRFSGVVRFLDVDKVADVANMITASEKTDKIGNSKTFRLYCY
jgi:hypothetical protein